MEYDSVEFRAKLEQLATKEDLHRLEATFVKWLVGTMAISVAVTVAVMGLVLNYAAPPWTPALSSAAPVVMLAPAQPPVIIVLPGQGGAVQWPPQPATK